VIQNILKNKCSSSNIILAIGVCFFCVLYFSASGKYFWLDEITTFNDINDNSIKNIPHASMSVETQPPLYHLTGKFFTSVSSDPQIIRMLTGFSFLGCFYLYYLFFKNQWFSFFLCFLYLCYSPSTTYFLTEFRPYTFSAFFILLYMYCLILWKDDRKYTVCSVLLLAFSLTLSITAPYVILGYLWLGLVIFRKGSFRGINKSILAYFLCLSFSALSYTLLILYNYWHVKRDFDLGVFYQAVLQNWNVVLKAYLLNQPFLLLILFVVSTYRLFTSRLKEERQVILLSLVIVSTMTIFTTFLFHQRIGWYSFRYSYLLYFFIPFLVLPVKVTTVSFKSFDAVKSRGFILLILLVIFILRFQAMDFETRNHRESQIYISYLENAATCINAPVYVVPKPFHIQIELRFHVLPFLDNISILHEDKIENLRGDYCLIVYYKWSEKEDVLFSKLESALKNKNNTSYSDILGKKGFAVYVTK
jgi:hypothetical protein